MAWLLLPRKDMQIPVEITFHNLEASPALEALVREKVAYLERFSDRITSCRVAIEECHRQHRKGNTFRVRIDLTLPGKEIVVGRDPAANHAHEDAYVAVRDAFKAARRRLDDHTRQIRGRVKLHEPQRGSGTVRALFRQEGYGFIQTSQGREIYFHENSVQDGSFDALDQGEPVDFVEAEEAGEKGPQASAVFVRPATRPA